MKRSFSRGLGVFAALVTLSIGAHAVTPTRLPPSKTQVLQHFKTDASILKSIGSVPPAKTGSPTSTVTQNHVTCPTSGTLDINNAMSSSGSTVTDNQTIVAHSCTKMNAYEIDGTVKVLNTLNNATHTTTETLNGTIAIATYNADGTVNQSGDISFNNATVTVTVNAQGNVTTTTSGTITEGGVTFQFTAADMPNFGN